MTFKKQISNQAFYASKAIDLDRKNIAAIFIFTLILILTAGLYGGEKIAKKDYPIQPVNFTRVHFNDQFWAPKIEINRTVSIPLALKKCEETGRLDNFAIAGGLKKGEFKGDYPFDDTDVYKVLEGASYTLAVKYDKELDNRLDEIIKMIAAAQEDDGYLYTCRTCNCTRKNIIRWMGKERWVRLNSHELYNCGHLYEAAVAHYRATGKKNLLNVAIKNADLVNRVFGPGPNQKHVPSGHPIIEMALVKLYRVTGEEKYLQLAKYFVDETGRGTDGHTLSPYSQDHMPIIKQEEAVGHAVRFGYLYSGVADLAAITGDKGYIAALQKVWENVVGKKFYITGGIGARAMGEGFGNNYELPNMTAYCETCASIANVYWNHRLFLLTGKSQYIDVLERTLYNSLLSGVSLKGNRYFYDNPLESNGEHERQEWFGCACCPGNVTRFMASVPGYQYGVVEDGIFVNLFAAGTAKINVNGKEVKVHQVTQYPWVGKIQLQVESKEPVAFKWHIRIPGWAQNQAVPSDLYTFSKDCKEKVSILKKGKPISYETLNGYAVIPGTWQKGETIDIQFPMPVRRIISNKKVVNDTGKIALQRGPIVYCLEGKDNDNGFLFDTVIPAQSEIRSRFEKDLLNGVVTLGFQGKKFVRENDRVMEKAVDLKAIPYHTWNNRGPDFMLVWIPGNKDAAVIKPKPTIASTSKPSASTKWAPGLNDGFEPKHSADTDKQFFYWWLKKGTEEWVQYTFDKPQTVKEVQVYWLNFDHYDYICRPPASWEVLYKKGDQWLPMQSPTPYTTEIDRYNKVSFTPVNTTAIRIRAQLKKDVSAGIMEWKVF